MDVAIIVLVLILVLVVAEMCRSRFAAAMAVDGGGGDHLPSIIWPSPPLSDQAVREFRTRLRRNPEAFGPAFGPADSAALATFAEAHPGVDAAALESIRHLDLLHRWGRARVDAERARRLAAEGLGPLEVARRLRAPPHKVAQALGIEAGSLEGRACARADLGAPEHARAAAAAAAAYEAQVGTFLRMRDLAYEDEAALRARLPAGAPTPDFLLRTPARINGHEVRWLDAKNYAGCGAPLVEASQRRQAAKYVAAYGPGAFVYAYGATRAAAHPGTIALKLKSIA